MAFDNRSHSFLAVDWGTTNRRIYLIENGRVARTERDAQGVTAISDFDAAVADVFGYYAWQVGLADLNLLRANRMPFKGYVGTETPTAESIAAAARNLLRA